MTQAQARDVESKAKIKHYGDKRRNAKPHSFVVGDSVLLDQTKNKKIWPKKHHLYDSSPLVVTATKGSMVTVMARNGRVLTRDASWFKRCTSDALLKSPLEVEPELQEDNHPSPYTPTPEPASDWEKPANDQQASFAEPSVSTATSAPAASFAEVASRPLQATDHAAPHLNPPSPNQTAPQQRRTTRAAKPVDRFTVKHAARGQGLR